MWLFDLFRKQEREKVLDGNDPNDLLLKALLSDEEITRENAMAIPAVSSSVDLICNTFASVPIKLYKEKIVDGKKITEEVDDARVNLINDDTKDTLDGYQFKKAICEDYLMGKGGYAYIKKAKNKVVGLYYVEEKHVLIKKNQNPIYKNFNIVVNNDTYSDYEFIKLLRNTKDGAKGIGLTKEIGASLKTAFRRLKYEYDLTVTGGSRKGFIKSQKHLDEKAIKALKDAWENYYSGNANTVILNDGLEFQEASNNSQQNEINEKNVTFIKEIKDMFHISDNYNEFIKNGVMPILNAFICALNRELLLEREKKDYYFSYDVTELLRGSIEERYNAYKIAIESGFKTRNEIRYLENDNAIEGLDVINLGLGDVLLDANTGNIYTPNTGQLLTNGISEQEPKLAENKPNDSEIQGNDINTLPNSDSSLEKAKNG